MKMGFGEGGKGIEEMTWPKNPQTAFLGPQLWDRKLSFTKMDQDLKSQSYRSVELDQKVSHGYSFA